jgi:hypothetical protein
MTADVWTTGMHRAAERRGVAGSSKSESPGVGSGAPRPPDIVSMKVCCVDASNPLNVADVEGVLGALGVLRSMVRKKRHKAKLSRGWCR